MSRKRFSGLLDGPGLFEELDAQRPAVDPEALESRAARVCANCRWLSLEDVCACCGAPLEPEEP